MNMNTTNNFSNRIRSRFCGGSKILIAPSILAADFAALGSECGRAAAAGADMLHIDVMDGSFVPNISLGVPVVKSLRKATEMFLDVHLMIDDPDFYVPRFIDAGADGITVHVESPSNIRNALKTAREAGLSCGITLKPATPVRALYDYLDMVDMVLIMTVEPGFGGQSFMHDMLEKITAVRNKAASLGRTDLYIQVDGGIDEKTAPLAVAAGADLLVAGTYLFAAGDMPAAVKKLKQS